MFLLVLSFEFMMSFKQEFAMNLQWRHNDVRRHRFKLTDYLKSILDNTTLFYPIGAQNYWVCWPIRRLTWSRLRCCSCLAQVTWSPIKLSPQIVNPPSLITVTKQISTSLYFNSYNWLISLIVSETKLEHYQCCK